MEIPLSRSEQKRRIKHLEKLVGEMGQLPAALIDALPCSNEIKGYLREAKSLKGGARKRTLKYITKLLKNDEESVEGLYKFMAEKKGNELRKKKDFHEIEYIRDSLLNEAIEKLEMARESDEDFEENWKSSVLEEIMKEFPEVDRMLLGRLAWLFANTRNSRHSREIFRILRASQEQNRIKQQQHNKG